MIALATIGLCALTQFVAKRFGIDLPDQQHVATVKQYAGWNWKFFSICLNAVIIMPVLEEIYFRYFVYRRNLLPISKRNLLLALIPTAVVFALGLALALNPTSWQLLASKIPHRPMLYFWLAVSGAAAAEYAVRVFLGRAIAETSVWSIAVASAVLFSAAHYIVQPFPDAAFVALAFFGLAQCWLYRKTERLWCPMLNHVLFNITNLVLLFALPEQGTTP